MSLYSLMLSIPGKGSQPRARAYTNLKEARQSANRITKDMGASCFVEVIDLNNVLHSTHCVGRACWKRKTGETVKAIIDSPVDAVAKAHAALDEAVAEYNDAARKVDNAQEALRAAETAFLDCY